MWIHTQVCVCAINLYSSLHSWYEVIRRDSHLWYASIFDFAFMIWNHIRVCIHDMNPHLILYLWYLLKLQFTCVIWIRIQICTCDKNSYSHLLACVIWFYIVVCIWVVGHNSNVIHHMNSYSSSHLWYGFFIRV